MATVKKPDEVFTNGDLSRLKNLFERDPRKISISDQDELYDCIPRLLEELVWSKSVLSSMLALLIRMKVYLDGKNKGTVKPINTISSTSIFHNNITQRIKEGSIKQTKQ